MKHYDKDGEHEFASDNLIIKGDCLPVMNSLKTRYFAKVKLAYLDPPYNTGASFRGYRDRFTHVEWILFMRPRLKVIKQLLRGDGVIFVSINDREYAYLKILMDEVFGEKNFIANIIWKSYRGLKNQAKYVSLQHEYILFYAKSKKRFDVRRSERTKKQDKIYKNRDNDPKGAWCASNLTAQNSYKSGDASTVIFKNGKKLTPPKGRRFGYSKQKLMELEEQNRLYFPKQGEGVYLKLYLSDVNKKGIAIRSVWEPEEVGDTTRNTKELIKALGRGAFLNPKGTLLIKKILRVANVQKNDLVLDCFAGSGTTAHAVIMLNKLDGGNRKYILIENRDYVKTVTVPRVQAALKQEDSADTFTYCGSQFE
jgi:adenine-specific DNA-methyltransferase